MGNSKVLIDFSTGKYSDAALSTKAGNIADKMDGNPNFTTPVIPIKELRDANLAYIAALAKVEYGTKEDTVVKNNLRKELVAKLQKLANYVQVVSEGEEAMILNSGFDTSKKPATVGQLDKPENVMVKPGENNGTVTVTCEAVLNAHFYEFQYKELQATDSVWMQKTSTKRKVDIDGLTSGKQYAFRVAGAGSYPVRVWSTEVLSYVL